MIVASAPPYFAPHPGYFYKAQLADVLVILDSVQFPRGTTWLSRNRFKNDQGTLWLTVPVWKKGLGLQSVNAVRICHEFRWAEKHLQSLQAAYARTPYLADHLPFVAGTYASRPEYLLDLNLELIRYLTGQFRIRTEIKMLSELGVRKKGSEIIVEICDRLNAGTFVVQKAAGKYVDAASLAQAGVELRLVDPPACVYPQLWGDFIPDLSSLDLLFNCGPRARAILMGEL